MNDTERFPKPDVPWLHEIEPDLLWPHMTHYGVTVVSIDGRWTATVIRRTDVRPCPARNVTAKSPYPTPAGGWWCALPQGHESPHLSATRPDTGVSSLRRVALPAQVSS